MSLSGWNYRSILLFREDVCSTEVRNNIVSHDDTNYFSENNNFPVEIEVSKKQSHYFNTLLA